MAARSKTKKLHLLLAFIAISCFGCSPKFTNSTKHTKTVQQISEQFIRQDSILNNHFVGFLLKKLDSSFSIVSINENHRFTPASNLKLFTFYLATQVMPDGIPAYQYAQINDSLIIRGTGDPSLLYVQCDHPLITHLIKTNKKIFLNYSNFGNKKYGQGWAWDDAPFAYQKEITPLAIYGNAITLSIKNDTVQINPDIFEKKIHTDSSLQQIYRFDKQLNSISINPLKLKKIKSKSLEVPIHYTGQLIAKILGKSVDKEIQILHKVPKNIKFNTVVHNPLDLLYKKLLGDSDNFVAEQLLLAASLVLFDTLHTKIAINYALDSLLHRRGMMRWVDASGLSRYNLVSPENIVSVLQKLARQIPLNQLKYYMTQSDNPTLPKPFKQFSIFAKTGTLSNNFNLSGYWKAPSGNLYVFSFMNNHYLHPKKEVVAAMARLFEKIAPYL